MASDRSFPAAQSPEQHDTYELRGDVARLAARRASELAAGYAAFPIPAVTDFQR
jgi:hypothetical protein